MEKTLKDFLTVLSALSDDDLLNKHVELMQTLSHMLAIEDMELLEQFAAVKQLLANRGLLNDGETK